MTTRRAMSWIGLVTAVALCSAGPLSAQTIEFRMVTAGPLRVAAFRAEGSWPEAAAFEKLKTWAEPRDLMKDPSSFLLFGRNDPPPTPGREGYGYVYMLTLPAGFEAGKDVEILELPRAAYLVCRARLANIGTRWEALYRRAESSGLTVTGHGVEEHLDLPGTVAPGEMLFDLWLPVEEPVPAGE